MENNNRPDFITNAHLTYLDRGHQSRIDMRAARSYLLAAFPDLTKYQAGQILDYWRQTRPKPQTNGKSGPRPGGSRSITAQNQKELAPQISVYVGDTPEERATFEAFRQLDSRGRLRRLVEGERAMAAVGGAK
jgi:hypothetical protein